MRVWKRCFVVLLCGGGLCELGIDVDWKFVRRSLWMWKEGSEKEGGSVNYCGK